MRGGGTTTPEVRDFMGADAWTLNPREHIDIITNELGLPEEDQDKILGLNAKALFGFPDPE